MVTKEEKMERGFSRVSVSVDSLSGNTSFISENTSFLSYTFKSKNQSQGDDLRCS